MPRLRHVLCFAALLPLACAVPSTTRAEVPPVAHAGELRDGQHD